MMNGGAPSMSGMMDSMGSDSMTKGFAALGDQGDPMKMATSGNALPGANPSPSNGLNAAPTVAGMTPINTTISPLVQASTKLSPQQMQMLAQFIRSRKI
jgi:hypothetical protein